MKRTRAMTKKVKTAVKKEKEKEKESGVSVETAKAYGVVLPDAPTDKYLSPNEIGKILNVTGEAVKQWIYHRRLPAIKLANGYWKIRVSDFETFMKNRLTHRRRVLVLANKEIIDVVSDLGHEIVTANGMSDALLKSVDLIPALTVIDLSMSEFQPFKLVEYYRSAKRKQLQTIPILFLANDSMDPKDVERAIELNIKGLVDPKEKETVKKEVCRLLEIS